MNLIDWAGVARNALWIAGLSLALAAWSYTGWLAASRKESLRSALGWAVFRAPFFAGLALFAAGLAWAALSAAEKGAWAALAAACAWQMVRAWRRAPAGIPPVRER